MNWRMRIEKTLLCLMIVGLVGCRSAPTVPPAHAANTGEFAQRNYGYGMLHELTDKLSGVKQALIMGSMDDVSEQLIQDIAQAAGDAHEQINAFTVADPTLDVSQTGLPEADIASKKAMEARATRQMIFAGSEFELRLLSMQIEATTFVSTLAKAVAELDKQQDRRRFLNQLSKDFEELHKRVMQRLTVRDPEDE